MSLALGALFQIAVAVQAPDTIVALDAVPIVVRATVPGNTPPALAPLRASGATLDLVRNEVRVGGGFGQAVATREVRYVLRAPAAGRAVIEPPLATLGADSASAPSHPLVVLDVATAQVPSIVERAPLDPRRLVDFHASVSPDTVWVGEQVTVQAGVFIDETGRARLRRNPEYVPSTVDGAVAYDLPLRLRELPIRTAGPTRFRSFVFARALFPLRAGTLVVPASRLSYGLGVGSALFGREETVTLESERATVIVRTPPEAGRPATWDGAVGQWTMSGGVERDRARVGDPVPVAITLAGTGNVKLLPPPRLVVPGAQVNAAGDVVQVDSSQLVVRGTRTFRFMVVPQREGRLVVGPATFAYFDPAEAGYRTLSLPVDTIEVAPGALAAVDTIVAEPALPLLTATPWVPATPLLDDWWFRGAALATLLGLGLAWRPRAARAPSSRARRAATKAARERLAGATLADRRRAILDELADIARLPADAPVAPGTLRRALLRAGATRESADAAATLVEGLDAAVFAPGAHGTPDTDAATLVATLREELRPAARGRATRGRRASALVLVVATLAGSAVRGDAAGGAGRDDARAAGDYAAQRYDSAAARFASHLAAHPRDAVQWANLGAAHWMRGDTAGAVVAWQRSARLAPLGTPVRDWLAASGVSAGGPRAVLPPVPVDLGAAEWLALAAALAVTLAASARATPAWRAPVRAAGGAALVAGALVLALAWWAERAGALAVARRPVALRAEPAVAGEVVSRAQGGDVGVREAARGAWLRLRLADGRAGWVAADAVAPLDAAAAAALAAAEARLARGEAAP